MVLIDVVNASKNTVFVNYTEDGELKEQCASCILMRMESAVSSLWDMCGFVGQMSNSLGPHDPSLGPNLHPSPELHPGCRR